ncbi:hypothetical protein [Burkholderia gladioli]|uniref:hypothetical protein n=1 Tax=Burkholderia gladioli TaxID=28095 RepID=UPI0037096906
MRARSLTAALAVAFGAMTLAVFALVGSYVYLQLDRQVSEQSDLDVVLAARHARRLAEELASAGDVRAHAERLSSVVFGNNALSFAAAAEDGELLASRNLAITLPGDPAAARSGPMRASWMPARTSRRRRRRAAPRQGPAPTRLGWPRSCRAALRMWTRPRASSASRSSPGPRAAGCRCTAWWSTRGCATARAWRWCSPATCATAARCWTAIATRCGWPAGWARRSRCWSVMP